MPILLVEDNAVNRQVVLMQLKKLGLSHIDWAGNGEEAVHKARSKEYALIFMDQMMPIMNGIEAAVRIRSDEAEFGTNPARIIALTGSADARQTCLEAGMDDYLLKPLPLNLHGLAQSLNKWLPQSEEVQVLDLAVIEDIRQIYEEGSTEMLALLLDMYRSEMPGKLGRLRELLTENNGEEAATVAHHMKAGSLSLGICRFSLMLADMEAAALNGELDKCRELYEQLFPAYEEACLHLDNVANA